MTELFEVLLLVSASSAGVEAPEYTTNSGELWRQARE